MSKSRCPTISGKAIRTNEAKKKKKKKKKKKIRVAVSEPVSRELRQMNERVRCNREVLLDGNITVRQRMRVTMSCDHRVIDGATGARFLQSVKRLIEDPLLLVL